MSHGILLAAADISLLIRLIGYLEVGWYAKFSMSHCKFNSI